jgi:RNA polymerase sigma factor (sigma-70 family)
VQILDVDSSYVHETTSIARTGGGFRPAIRERVTKVKTDWEAVYRSVYPEVLRFLRWMLWDDERARDLAQEAFVRVIGKDADNPRGLVFRTASNLARDEARMIVRRKRHLSLLRVEEDVRAEQESSPARELEARERAERLRRALAELSETDREVLLLWNAGFDYAEIAAQTGLARGAIGTTVARAKKKLVSAHDALESTDAALG